jgi:hypothetical protein
MNSPRKDYYSPIFGHRCGLSQINTLGNDMVISCQKREREAVRSQVLRINILLILSDPLINYFMGPGFTG